MIRFFVPDIERSPFLTEDEARHCIKVLRHSLGDSVEVVDGRGYLYHCIIREYGKLSSVRLEIKDKKFVNKNWHGNITVAIAPTKNMERMEWMVEKLTEIGIDRIIPVICSRSERRRVKNERMEKIAVSAMKQSLKAYKPEILLAVTMDDLMKLTTKVTYKYIAFCGDGFEKKTLANEPLWCSDCVILIGPEGDFTQAEVSLAVNNGYVPVTLGESRLRTETAAIVALDTFHFLQQVHLPVHTNE